jgi:hypothetical protein
VSSPLRDMDYVIDAGNDPVGDPAPTPTPVDGGGVMGPSLAYLTNLATIIAVMIQELNKEVIAMVLLPYLDLGELGHLEMAAWHLIFQGVRYEHFDPLLVFDLMRRFLGKFGKPSTRIGILRGLHPSYMNMLWTMPAKRESLKKLLSVTQVKAQHAWNTATSFTEWIVAIERKQARLLATRQRSRPALHAAWADAYEWLSNQDASVHHRLESRFGSFAPMSIHAHGRNQSNRETPIMFAIRQVKELITVAENTDWQRLDAIFKEMSIGQDNYSDCASGACGSQWEAWFRFMAQMNGRPTGPAGHETVAAATVRYSLLDYKDGLDKAKKLALPWTLKCSEVASASLSTKSTSLAALGEYVAPHLRAVPVEKKKSSAVETLALRDLSEDELRRQLIEKHEKQKQNEVEREALKRRAQIEKEKVEMKIRKDAAAAAKSKSKPKAKAAAKGNGKVKVKVKVKK